MSRDWESSRKIGPFTLKAAAAAAADETTEQLQLTDVMYKPTEADSSLPH